VNIICGLDVSPEIAILRRIVTTAVPAADFAADRLCAGDFHGPGHTAITGA
jgi:hypothetical protein